MKLKGTVTPGYLVASGTSQRDKRFPGGTIRMQAPFFAAQGLDLDTHFAGKQVWGTLNIDTFPFAFKQLKSDFFFKDVFWTTLQPAENFYLSHATVVFNGTAHKALLYNPDPDTKPNHFHFPHIMEFIAERIDGIAYGSEVEVTIPDGYVQLTELKGERPPPLASQK